MKIKSTFLILFISIWVNQFYGQFSEDKPDLRDCGNAPNYYLDYFNCNSNNYTLDDVYLSISNSSGQPIVTPCIPPDNETVFLWLNYTSNSNSSIHQTRIFADIVVKDQNGIIVETIQTNSYLGEVLPSPIPQQSLLVISNYENGYNWTCGYELSLVNLLVVWQTNGNSNDPELLTYNCSTYNKSQCELPISMIVSAPLAVQFDYTQCTINGVTTINFDNDTNGGSGNYTYLWNFGDNTTSTSQNPTHTYPYPSGPYTVTLQVFDNGSSPPQNSTSQQIVNLLTPISITGNVTSSPCSTGNVGAIDISVSGGTPFLTPTLHYNYLWSNGATSQDITGLANGPYTVTVTDSVGCTAQQTFIITGGDVTPPVVTAPANLTLQGCNTNAIATNGYFPFSSTTATITPVSDYIAAGGTISDASAISSVTYIDTVSGTCPKTVTRLFTIKDACNNTATVSQIITIQDVTAPVIAALPAISTINCPAVPNFTTPTATDACGGTVTLTFADVTTQSTACPLKYYVTRTWTAKDDCNNTATASQIINVQDVTPPVIAPLPAISTINCPAVPSFATATATDACGGPVTLTFADVTTQSTACPLKYYVTRTWTAKDDCNNTATTSQIINVQDVTPPVFSIQVINQSVECNGTGNASALAAWLASHGGASASDACSGVTWTNNYTALSDLCGATGSASVTFTATDACGNASSSTGTFTIQDTVDPVFTSELPQNISVSCDAIPLPQELTGSDSCSGQITVTTNDDIVENEGTCTGQFTILRTWTITDSCGNDLSYTQTISVYDNTAPTLVTELDTELFDIDCSVIPEIPQLEFTDNCSGVDPNIVYTETTTIISIYQYVIIREWTVSDNCGNEASFSQTINVSVDEPFDAIPYNICTNETVDLFTIEGLPDDLEQLEGTWVEVNSSGALNGSIFNPSNLILGNYYTVRYIVDLEDNSCPMIYEVYIHVDCEVLAECDIVVFNAVSPNGDGLNEVFTISGITCYPNNTVEIYNRWGVNVYKARGYNNGSVSFDGQSQNKLTVGDDKLPGDTYFYILKYIDNENNSIEKTGYLYVKY